MSKKSKLSKAERFEIGVLWNEKLWSYRAIGRAMQRSHNTIAYEVNANSVRGVYDPHKAHAKALVDRQYRKLQWSKIEHDHDLKKYIVDKLKKHWNPDVVSGRMRTDHEPFYVSKTAIYDWLYSAWGQRYCRLLYTRRYRPKYQQKNSKVRAMIPERTSITVRPQHINSRRDYGHWEGDAVVSGKRGMGALAVASERKSRLVRAEKVATLSSAPYVQTLKKMTTGTLQKSWTFDNGIENKKHQELGVPTFFCDPYSSWQKGGVENVNQLLRRFFPKGTNFANVAQELVDRVVERINNMPRKILKYRTAIEVAHANGVLLSNSNVSVLIEG